jgi:hypothetical protein
MNGVANIRGIDDPGSEALDKRSHDCLWVETLESTSG